MIRRTSLVGLLHGCGVVVGYTAGDPLVTVPLQHPARSVRVDVPASRGAVTKRNGLAVALCWPPGLPACGPLVQRFVIHGLPSVLVLSVCPRPGRRRNPGQSEGDGPTASGQGRCTVRRDGHAGPVHGQFAVFDPSPTDGF